ncbi:MAG: hypothetical protein HYW78_00165 [Parcubacteria group bacterium]|nr:hypothetical protein [Parcubacteria group bacterium]
MELKQREIKPKKIKETPLQKIVNHYFRTKGLTLARIKEDARKQRIVYGRHARAAKELLELAGSVEVELEKLAPREKIKKPYYQGFPMKWSDNEKKWFVIVDNEWKEFVGNEGEIEWK